jgi:hypothetical protein
MRKVLLLAAVLGLVVASAVGGSGPTAGAQTELMSNRFAPSGVVDVDSAEVGATVALAQIGATAAPVPPSPFGTSGCSDGSTSNVRVNQECTNQSVLALLGRGQSQNETAVAVNPTNPDNILVGQNDYRRGDATCGVDFSLNGGRKWGSGLIPVGFTAPGFTAPRHYWDAGGDPAVGFDSDGYAYYACLAFNRGVTSDLGGDASGIFVFRSADGGASWSFSGNPVTQTDGTGGDGIGLEDKEWMAIDISATSPFQNRVYVTWTRYNFEFTTAHIYESHSADHGITWSAPKAISGISEELCPFSFGGGAAGDCDANQFSNVFTSPSGDVFVVFQNFNNCPGGQGDPCEGDPTDNHNQMLLVKSTDGGETWSAPVKVADFFDLPDCFEYTGHDAGRACVPTAPLTDVSIFRATNYPTGVAVTDDEIVVDFGSYINPNSNPDLGNCAPAGLSQFFLNLYDGVGDVGGCNNDILRSVSTDGGASFTGTTTPPQDLPAVSDESHGQVADQFWQYSALNPRTGKVLTAYYDRRYGDDQATGFIDISILLSNGNHRRVTNRSMPPSNEFPSTNGYSLFVGDYMQLAVGPDGIAYPVWTDTRNPIFTFDPTGDARVPVFAGYGGDAYIRAIRDHG